MIIIRNYDNNDNDNQLFLKRNYFVQCYSGGNVILFKEQ